MPRASKCDTCGANILWARTVNGKSMPLDAKPEPRFIITDDGVCVSVKAHKSHFSTCPQAGEHRRPRGA